MTTFHRSCAILAALAISLYAVQPVPAAIGDCGQPLTFGNKPTAADALAVLRAAVGAISCTTCVCDVNADGDVTSGDALRVLRFAVGAASDIDCLICKSETVIGPAGGLLASLDGSVTLVFPPGAVAGETTVSIEGAAASELPAALRANGGASAWRLEPDSLEPDVPVSVRIPGRDISSAGVIGEQLTLIVSIEGDDVEALQDQASTIQVSGTVSVSSRASLSHFSILGIVPLEVSARLAGVPAETTVDQQHSLTAVVIQAPEEEVVDVVTAGYIDDDFGSWQPADGFAIFDELEETVGGTFAGSHDYVCTMEINVGFSPEIVTVMDVPGVGPEVEHTTFIDTSLTCVP